MSTPDEVRSPNCPLCGQPPMMLMGGGTQAFCGTDECRAISWNPYDDPATFLATAKRIDLTALSPEGGGTDAT